MHGKHTSSKHWISLFLLAIAMPVGCASENADSPVPGSTDTFKGIVLTQVFETASFSRPLALIAGPANSRYVVEQAGRILRLVDGQPATEFANITVNNGPNEAGLLVWPSILPSQQMAGFTCPIRALVPVVWNP